MIILSTLYHGSCDAVHKWNEKMSFSRFNPDQRVVFLQLFTTTEAVNTKINFLINQHRYATVNIMCYDALAILLKLTSVKKISYL